MLVSIILEWACDCGTTAKGVTVKQLRINKLSMRTTGQALGLMPRVCKGCAKPLPDWAPFGRYAGRNLPHDFRPMNSSQCLECWGWADDPRHPVTAGLAAQ